MSEAKAQLDSEELLKGFATAVSEDLATLAALHHKEAEDGLVGALREIDFPRALGLTLQSEASTEILDVMQGALAALPDPLDEANLNDLAADYANIYLNYGIQVSPEESVWIDDENLVCQVSMFQVREWYQRYGVTAEDWRMRPDDHLVLQLQFLSNLLAREVSEELLVDVARFMDEHLLRWLGDFSLRVAQRCATPFYAGAAMLTDLYCEELRELLTELVDCPRPSKEELEDRMRPRLRKANEEEGGPYVPGMGAIG